MGERIKNKILKKRETVDYIKRFLSQRELLRNNPNHNLLNIKFYEDSLPMVFKATVVFDTSYGLEWDNDCDRFFYLGDAKTLKKAFVRVLNNHISEIFKEMAEEIEADIKEDQNGNVSE